MTRGDALVGGTVLDGAPNFRDLGGTPVEGGVVAPGRLFRSEALTTLTAAGRRTLGGLGIHLVCDLRTAPERRTEITRDPGDGARVLVVDEGIDLYGSSAEHIRTMYGDDSGRGARELVRSWYAEMARVYAPVVGELLTALAAGEGPALVHCSAGKDRTGFVVAVVLRALGASRETVEADYLLTDRFFAADRLRAAVRVRIDREASDAVVESLRVHADYLRAALDAIDAEHGSVSGYLEHLGLDEPRRSALREALVDPR